jgi:hypothetical protein
MSFEAMAWASTANAETTTNKLVLLMLANYANAENEAYPSYKTLANLCLCNERTVIRSIKSLVDLGLIEVHARFRDNGKQTSNIFVLNVGGDKIDGVWVTNKAPNTIIVKHKEEKSKGGDKKVNQYPEAFLDWWKAYPRKDGSKKKAFDGWRLATKDLDPDFLLQVTIKFRKHCVSVCQDPKYIPHATTWLNQRRWETVTEQSKTNVISLNNIAG